MIEFTSNQVTLKEGSRPAKVVAGSSFRFEYKMRNAGACREGTRPSRSRARQGESLASLQMMDSMCVRCQLGRPA